MVGRAFLYGDRPAIVDLDDDGVKYRLYAFADGEWSEGDEVAIPGANRTWHVDEITGVSVMDPCTGCARPTAAQTYFLQVASTNGKDYLIYRDVTLGKEFTAFREGFDFISNDIGIASGMAPENVAAETTGWTRLNFEPNSYGQFQVWADRLIVNSQTINDRQTVQIWEKQLSAVNAPFRLVATPIIDVRGGFNAGLVSSLDRERLYLIGEDSLQFTSYEYRDGQLTHVQLPWDTDMKQAIRWLGPTLFQLCGILCCGVLMLVGGAEWISRFQNTYYEFGIQSRILAPIWKRCLARGIDLLLIFALLICDVLRPGLEGFIGIVMDIADHGNLSGQHNFDELFTPSTVWMIVMFAIFVSMQAYTGLTPGKWLCGLRTVRTTLRPCGFARSLLRELVLCFDAPLLLTVLPAVSCLLLTHNRQRIGDLMADTIVIDITANKVTRNISERGSEGSAHEQ